jgi:sulfopyruvate decarboxylase subunit alpha
MSSANASGVQRPPGAAAASPSSSASRFCEALVDGGADLAIYLPDSVLSGAMSLLERDPRIPTIVCSREDEGMAIAAGAALAGALPAVLMEGSGVGFGGLILARAQVQRSAFLIVASHSPALGEPFDYHAATRVVAAATLSGLGIPFTIPRSIDELVDVTVQSLQTVAGQRAIVGILVPPFVLREPA